MWRNLIVFLFIFCCFSSCKKTAKDEKSTLFSKTNKTNVDGYDWDHIQESGELIVGTISGPDTYFDYNGAPMGLQFALAQNFAQENGLHIRIELAKNTQELCQLLLRRDIDIAVYPLKMKEIIQSKLTAAGVLNVKAGTSWAVASQNEDLAEALKHWYQKGLEEKVQKDERQRIEQRFIVHRHVRSPYLSREKGIISVYDDYFRDAARTTGWDWRLIAAQCYQESGFDPNAQSGAGAQGLMQLMPATAASVGLADVYAPKENIQAAARYIKVLQRSFASIRDRYERIHFILAAYNAGSGHIKDAQALARKYGKNPDSWNDVSFFVQALSTSKYYTDEVVKYGYMIGSQTSRYVEDIIERWRGYGGRADFASPIMAPSEYHNIPRKPNRFTKGTVIVRPDNGISEIH
jgi:extracellular solute-binding protein, family 3